MAIRFLPSEIAKRIAPKKAVEKLVTQKLTLNRVALNMLARSGVLSKKTLTEVTLKVLKSYKKSYSAARKEGDSKSDAVDTAINNKKLLVQRVQNTAVFQITEQVREQYAGEFYEWLPSDANEPDPLHQLNYGKKFKLGAQEDPGERFGCRCGMNILVRETKLEL